MDKSKERIRKLMSADVRMGEAYYLFSRRRGVKENELNVLYALDDGGAHTQQQIVRDWLMPKTTVNTTVKALVREGYATLLPQGGGRDKQIVLTEEGRKKAEEVHENFSRMDSQIWEGISGEEMEKFLSCAQKIIRNLEEV